MTNLLQNIVDYDVGKNLVIETYTNRNYYTITFSHSGNYIDPLKKDLIFERFYRLEESRSTKADGAGLGLAIARSIIEAHEGKIGLTTNGSDHKFWIMIPIYQPS